MSVNEPSDELTANEVMRLLRISHTTLNKWQRNGTLVPIPRSPAVKRAHRFYRRADVERLMPPPDEQSPSPR